MSQPAQQQQRQADPETISYKHILNGLEQKMIRLQEDLKTSIKKLETDFLDFKKNSDEIKTLKQDINYQNNLFVNRFKKLETRIN